MGKIKYIKDGEVDADLDPEMSVYDAFVDAGEAATSAKDQRAAIKIIREIRGQRFGVREGSMVPDLSKPHFQQRTAPPVPRFSDTNPSVGKRSRDDAFRDEGLNGDVSHNSPAVRKPRIGGSKERGIEVIMKETVEDLVPSIERELHEPRRRTSRDHGSPIVILETQGSPLQHGLNARRDGSEILGDDEAKSESPEVDNSIHSLPLAPRDANDAEIPETAETFQDTALPKVSNQDHVQAWSGADSNHNPASRSSSNYFSLSSGSLQSISKARVSGHQSASSATEESNLVNAKPSFTGTKLDVAKEGIAENGPITPPSDASRPLQTKGAARSAASTVSKGIGPQSRNSSFSYKFRRQDRVHSAESEIDDTQMSPGSRKSLKRPRHARQSEAAPKDVGVRELSGLFHHLNDNRPLIQERKRQRKETTWDFSERVDGLSETEDEDPSPSKEQDKNVAEQAENGSDPSESHEADDVVQRRSKSEALSDETDKNSNASTERPIMSNSLNALWSSQQAQNQASDAGVLSHPMEADDSDKENADHKQSMYTELHPSVTHKDGDVQMLEIPQEKEGVDFDRDTDNSKQDSESVVAILNDITDTGGLISAQETPQDARQSLSVIPEQVKPSSTLPNYASSKTSHSRKKKKSRVEDEEPAKPANEKAEACTSTQAPAFDPAEQAKARSLGSTIKSKLGKKSIRPTGPDEQLSQDLQASAEAGNKNITPVQKNGKSSSAKTKAAGLGTKIGGAAGVDSGGDPSSQSRKPKPDVSLRISVTDEGGKQASVRLKDQRSSNPTPNASVGTPTIPMETSQPDKSKDGKLGLGFSQSPPRKGRALLHSNVGMANLDNDHHNEASEALRRGKDESNFLKKSSSSNKLMSIQSWKADTPTRSTQPRNKLPSKSQHTSVDIPSRQPDSLLPQNKVKVIGAMQPVASESGSESPSSDEDSSDNADEEVSKADEAPVQNGKIATATNAAVQSIEVSSDSSGTESHAEPTSSKVTQASKPRTAATTIVSKGNNEYLVNGKPVIVPLGYTVDSYMAMRANLEHQPKQNPKNGITRSGKSGTPTLNARSSTSTPVPAPSKVAPKPFVPKNDAKRTLNATKARDSPKPSSQRRADNGAAKQITNVSKTKGSQQPPPAAKAKKEPTTKARNTPKTQENWNASIPPKNQPAPPTRPSTQPVAALPAKSIPLNMLLPRKAPSFLHELRAERAKMAAALSSKPPIKTTPNLANGKNFVAGDDSESESDSDTETTSSDDNVTASKAKPVKTPAATGRAVVDLSIRDPTPSSAGEEESD